MTTAVFGRVRTPWRVGVPARLALALGILFPLTVAVTIFATALGPAGIPFGASAAILFHRVGIGVGQPYDMTQQQIVEQIRLPRIITAGLVGAALALAGVTMQGLFRNPLADPGIIGVSSGGALGAVVALAFGLAAGFYLVLPLLAFLGALGAGLLVYGIAASGGRFTMSSLLLAGVAVSAFLGACTSAVLTYYAAYSLDLVREILFWLLGGFDARSWLHVQIAAPPILLGTLVLLFFARDLNLLLLGEEGAQSLGVPVAATRGLLLAVSALITGAAVSVSGTIGFVGLVVPHMLRLVFGPDHRVLLPASALGGASFLILADTVARLILRPAEVRVGIVTALVGAPFFLLLLYRNRRRAGAL